MMILKVVGFVILGIGLFGLVTYVFMRVWNWLVPGTFNGPRLGFGQALGLLFLSRVLVGGFGYGGGYWRGEHGGRWRQSHHRFFDRADTIEKNRRDLPSAQPEKPVPAH